MAKYQLCPEAEGKAYQSPRKPPEYEHSRTSRYYDQPTPALKSDKPSKPIKGQRQRNAKLTVKNPEHFVGNLMERGGGGDQFGADTIAAYGSVGNDGEVRGADQSGVATNLHKLFRANKDGAELEQCVSLPRPPQRHRCLQVEEGDLRPAG